MNGAASALPGVDERDGADVAVTVPDPARVLSEAVALASAWDEVAAREREIAALRLALASAQSAGGAVASAAGLVVPPRSTGWQRLRRGTAMREDLVAAVVMVGLAAAFAALMGGTMALQEHFFGVRPAVCSPPRD